MMLAAEQGGRLIAVLAAEPGFARLAEPGTAALLWRPGDGSPVWASAGGRALLSRLPKAPGGSLCLPPSTRARLLALGEGQAPRSGFRLERLRWSAMEAPLTFACRLASLDGTPLLLTAVLPQGAAARQPGVPIPPAGEGGDERSRSSRVTVVLPSARGRRFMWRADGEGRFTFVSPDLAEIVGARGADIVGRRWDELVGHLVEDRTGAVGAAWARGEGWSRLAVGWRDPGRERVVPVELSGAPESGAPPSWRGFGLAHPEQSRAAEPGLFREPSRRQEKAQEAAASVPADAAGSCGQTGEAVFGLLRAWLVPDEKPPAPQGGAPSDAAAEGLTSGERGALHEIARLLGGPAGERPPAPEDRPSADIVPLPRPRPRADMAALLDQLPIGCVVLREGAPLFANRSILDRLGFPGLPEAVAKGALQNLAGIASGGAAPASVSLMDAREASHPFEARPARVDWGEAGADLLLLSPPPAAPKAEIDALRLDLDARDRRLEQARAALDIAADAVVALDPAARLMALTRSAERLFGLAANEVVGDSVTALIEPADHRAVLACLDAARTGPPGIVQQREVRGRARGGGSIPLAMRAGHIPAEGGGFSVSFSDISRFRLLESDLRKAREAAEEASANRADFLARISHEVRTPLTAITGFAELMLEERFGTLGNERYKGYIRDIRDSGVHVISLVNDLLDLAKATSGSNDLRPESFDLNMVVQQCVALAGPLAGQEKTIIRTSFPAGLPRVFADERSIRQVVINLLSNAIRFTGAGGQVIVSTAAGGPGEIVLSVRDTGPGMSEDEVATALTPFRQVPATRRGDGTGLGLPLSKALTEANGGVFLVTSARDHGTLVELRLPVEKERAVAAE